MGDGQGHAGSQQDQRIEQRQSPGRNGLERATDIGRAIGRPRRRKPIPQIFIGQHAVAFTTQPWQPHVARVEQRAEERAEEHHLGEDEPHHPHPERAIHLTVVAACHRFADDIAEPHEQGEYQHRQAGEERPPPPAGVVEPAGHSDHQHQHGDRADEGPLAVARHEIDVGIRRVMGHGLLPGP
ncbi:hypothetical protein D9M71_516590 [compost metagenome]